MDSHFPDEATSPIRPTAEILDVDTPFVPGTIIIYPPHGKCLISSIELKDVHGEKTHFYRLEKQKYPASKSTKSESSIWVPIRTARERGLRLPINKTDAVAILEILSSHEYYFPISTSWHRQQIALEETLRKEGFIGLAKVFSFLYVFKKKTPHIPPAAKKFDESVSRQLVRELSETLEDSQRNIEERLNKLCRVKLASAN